MDVNTGLKPDELIGIIGDYEGLIVRSQTQVTADVIKAGKKPQQSEFLPNMSRL